MIVPVFAMGLSKHHAIYLGVDSWQVEWIGEIFQEKGVRKIRADDFFSRNPNISVLRFTDNERERREAIMRAFKEWAKPMICFVITASIMQNMFKITGYLVGK